MLEDRLDSPETSARKHGGVFVFGVIRRGTIHVDSRIGSIAGVAQPPTTAAIHNGRSFLYTTIPSYL